MKNLTIIIISSVFTSLVFSIWQNSLIAGIFMYMFLITLSIIHNSDY